MGRDFQCLYELPGHESRSTVSPEGKVRQLQHKSFTFNLTSRRLYLILLQNKGSGKSIKRNNYSGVVADRESISSITNGSESFSSASNLEVEQEEQEKQSCQEAKLKEKDCTLVHSNLLIHVSLPSRHSQEPSSQGNAEQWPAPLRTRPVFA